MTLRRTSTLVCEPGSCIRPATCLLPSSRVARNRTRRSLAYEIIDPQSVGVPASRLILGKHRGRHALHQRAGALGYELTREELEDLYQRFSAVAEHRKKGLMDEEIRELIEAGRQALEAANQPTSPDTLRVSQG